MRGDVATDICGRHTGLDAKRGDEGMVQIRLAHAREPDHEEKVDDLSSLPVWALGTLWTNLLPGCNGFSNDTIHWLGKSCPGLVDRHVEQAHCISGEDVARAKGSYCIALRADAADPQPQNLVVAKSSEEPSRRKGSAHLDGIAVGSKLPSPGRAATREVVGYEVEAGPDQLGPDIVGDDARVGADQGEQALRRSQVSYGIEPSRDQLPLLEIAKEDAKR